MDIIALAALAKALKAGSQPGGGDTEFFKINFTTDAEFYNNNGQGKLISDKTLGEILEAEQSGKMLVFSWNDPDHLVLSKNATKVITAEYGYMYDEILAFDAFKPYPYSMESTTWMPFDY